MSAQEYFHEAAICSIVAKCYENLGLVANAQYFKERAMFMLNASAGRNRDVIDDSILSADEIV